MNLGSLRNKQRQLHRALESIQVSTKNHLKIVTQVEQRPLVKQKRNILFQQTKQVKPSKRYGRGRHLVTQEHNSLAKYKSLELGPRNRKISHQKFERDGGSIAFEQGMHRSVKKKYSGHNLPVNQNLNERYFLKTKRPHKKDATEIKIQVQNLVKKGQFQTALNILNQTEEIGKVDIELMQLKGVCLMRTNHFEKALQVLSKVIIYDRKNCRQTYIWCAICQNQMGHSEKSMRYIDECLRLFPEHYEAYYYKGKQLLKRKMFGIAIQCFEQSSNLNPAKEEIHLYIAECMEELGDVDGAIEKYQLHLGDSITQKNIYHMAKLSRLFAEKNKISQADSLLQKCIDFVDKTNYHFCEESLLECAYLLSSAFYKTGQFQKSLMKGEWVLTRGKSRWTEPTIKVMIASKILERDFYGAINISQRLQRMGCKPTLGELGLFCNGVILLMRKKAKQAVVELQQCAKMLTKTQKNDLNAPVREVLHLYLFYAYSLLSKNQEALQQLQLQKKESSQELYKKATAYNQALTLGFIAAQKQEYHEAYQYFETAQFHDPSKVDPLLYMIASLFPLVIEDTSKSNVLRQCLDNCCMGFQQTNGNFAGHAFYYRALFKAWIGDWSNVILDCDLAIDKSEDNYPKFFLLRGLSWALVQNYKQAISDMSVALEIDPNDYNCYVLRARCLQIEGDPALAFNDLQSFIALRPDDKEIHKLAGHLLFENGAFEDALQAYSQGEVNEKDTEVFLTRSKTNFLLGNFASASQDMLQAAKSNQNNPKLLFDYQMLKWLSEIFPPQLNKQNEKSFGFDETHLSVHLKKLMDLYENQDESKMGKIFRQAQLFVFSAMCSFYLQEYGEAVVALEKVVEVKMASLMVQSSGDFQEDEAEKTIFINQMYYNMALCYCMLKNYEKAQICLGQCKIDPELHTYQTYQLLMGHIKGSIQVDPQEQYLDLFSLRNKISRFLPPVDICFMSEGGNEGKRKLKMCIPYPKVQPPDINPTFNKNMLQTINISELERRPEAPWILKEHNAIKFTDKMQIYSKLSLGESSVQIQKRGEFCVESESESFDIDFDIKKKLQLDEKVESKLNRVLRKL